MNAGSALAARSQGFVQLSVQDRRASRRFRQIAAPRASTGVNDGEETGLVYPGKAGGITPGNGVDKFLLDSGVKTTRTVKDGEVSVTIKIRDRQLGNSIVGGYILPVVGYGGTGYSADAARLRALQDEEDARRAALARSRLNNYNPSNLKIGYTIPASDLTMQNLAASEPAGSMAWGYDSSRSTDDPQYNYYNLYRDGDPKEAVKVTADAGFGALAEWLAKQQTAVEKEFKERVESVIAAMDEERIRALAEQKVTLEAEFEERLAGSLAALKSQLEAAHYKDKIDALNAQKTKLEAEAKAALEALTAKLTAEKEAALRDLESRLNAEWQAKFDAMRRDLEAQLAALRERVAQMERDHAAEISRLNAEHASAMSRQRDELIAAKEAALAQLRSDLEAERARALAELEARLQQELRATVERLQAEAQAALQQLREQLEQEKLAALADLERRLREEAEARVRVVNERLRAAELRVAELAEELRRAQEAHAREKAQIREVGMNGYAVIVRELDQVLTKSIAGAMEKVEETKTLTEKFLSDFERASN